MDLPGESSIPRPLLRKRLLRRRADIGPEDRHRLDAAIAARLDDIAVLRDAERIAVFWPIRSEPDLAVAHHRWRAAGKRLALPVVGGPNGGLLFCAWDRDAALVTGPYGIPIPQDKTPVTPDCLLIPCVGFRLHRGRLWRLGYGAGFYDRTLAHRPTPAVGVAYDEAASDDFVPNPDDEALSWVVTPSRVITSIASP